MTIATSSSAAPERRRDPVEGASRRAARTGRRRGGGGRRRSGRLGGVWAWPPYPRSRWTCGRRASPRWRPGPIAPPSRTASSSRSAPGERIHFLDWGGRPPAPLGGPTPSCSSTGWPGRPGPGPPSRAGSGRAVRTVAVDLRGHGLSDAPTTEYDPATLAGDLVAVAEGAGARRRPATAAGPAPGRRWPGTATAAIVAAWAAAVLGDRCAGLVLVDGGWQDVAAETGLTPAEFLRDLAEPPEVLASMDAFLDDRRGWDPSHWDADEERAARATVVEVPAGHVVPAIRPHALERSVEAIFAYRPVETLAALDLPIVALVAVDDEDGHKEAALAELDAARRAAGRPRDRRRAVPRRRSQPAPLPAGRAGRGDPPPRRPASITRAAGPPSEDPMRVVYTPAHLAHDVVSETIMGQSIPANEVPERAERIRAALVADGGFELVATDRARPGPDPRRPRPRARAVPRGGLAAGAPGGHRPWRAHAGHLRSAACPRASGPSRSGSSANRPRSPGGPGSGASTRRRRSWPGRTAPRAGAVDTALTAVDLVLDGGEPAVYGLCRPPGPPRRALDVRRLLLLQQRRDRGRVDRRADRRARRDPRSRLPPRERHRADLLAPRRRPVRLDPRRPRPAVPVLPRPGRRDGRGAGRRGEPQPPARGRRRRRALPRGARPGARGDRGDAGLGRSSSRSASTPTARTRSATSP